jgi:hypothetical protein
MSDKEDDYSEVMKNPYRDDPVWEDWHETACGVQGGAEDSRSSSESLKRRETSLTNYLCVQSMQVITYCYCSVTDRVADPH